METSLQSAIQESLPETDEQATPSVAPDDSTESSPVAPEAATSQQAEHEKPIPFHQHPDWIKAEQRRKKEDERWQRETAEAREEARKMRELAEKVISQMSAQNPEKDPYEGYSPEERLFMQNLDKRYEDRMNRILSKKEQEFRQDLQELRATQAALIYEKFQTAHPDVASGSQEEAEIAAKFQQGYALDDAYKLVMGDINHRKEMERLTAKIKIEETQKKQQKIAANQETPGLPSNAPITPLKKKTTAEFVEEFLKNNPA